MGISNEEDSRRSQVKGEIATLAALEETFWRQKSRALYVKEDDNNTRFFHRLVNSHRRASHISSSEVDGVLYEDGPTIQSQCGSVLSKSLRRDRYVASNCGWIGFCLHWRG